VLGLTPRVAPAAVLRPPGSAPGDAFLDLCIRCDACVKVCTYNALIPMPWAEGGFGNLWSPRFDMRRSACDTTCNACGQACPTGAIAPLSLTAKNVQRIGLAVIDPVSCWLWDGRSCDVCVAACAEAGYDAIEMFFAGGFEKIRVDAERCTGCGWCEHHCPENKAGGVVSGPAAIVVGLPPAAEAAPAAAPAPGQGFQFDDSGLEEETGG